MTKKERKEAKNILTSKEIEEKESFSSNFSSVETLSLKEHKMLVEGYKSLSLDEEYFKLEQTDLADYMFWERNNGGTTF